VTVIFTNTIQK